MADLIVRPASVSDIGSIGRVHRAAFRFFFLTQLGPAFLREYYRTVLEYPRGILLVAAQDESVVGFTAGFVDPPEFYSLLRKKRVRLGLVMLPWLIIHPGNLVRALSNYRLTRENSREADPTLAQVAEWSSLGVRPNSPALAAAMLIAAFKRVARESGASKIRLTTDAAGNAAINRTYVRAGYTLVRVIRRPYGRILNEYELDLGSVGSEAVTSRYLPERMDNHVEE